MPVDPALLPPGPPADVSVRLVCLPFAGGGSGLYGTWQEACGPDVEVLPVCLPGRERRLREPAYSSMATLVDDLFDTLRPRLDRPWVVFGHSMGGEIGHTLARRATTAGLPPAHLVVSARRGPASPRPHPPLFALPDALMVAECERHYGNLPDVLRRHPDVLATFLPTMRADFKLLDTWQRPTDRGLTCPITAIAGDADPTVPVAELHRWAEVTTGVFTPVLLSGDHFSYVRERHDARDLVVGIVRALAGR